MNSFFRNGSLNSLPLWKISKPCCRVKLSPYPILFVAPVAWNGLRQRHQALAQGLARRGFSLYYLNPLCGGGLAITAGSAFGRVRELTVRVPFRATGFPALQAIAVKIAAHLLRRSGICESETLLWVADPSMSGLIRGSWCGVVYDRCDLHGAFPGQRESAWRAYEDYLMERVDVFLATSENLLKGFNTRSAAVRILAPNAAESDFLTTPKRFRPSPPPLLVLSAGAHFEWVDFDWLTRISALPGVELHLAGPGRGEGFRRLLEETGVFNHGVLSREALRRLLDTCHVGVVAFRDIPLSRAVDPIKAYEYAARGLHVWGTDLASLRVHPMIDRVLSKTAILPGLVEETLELLAKPGKKQAPPTWDDRLSTIIPSIVGLME